MPLDQNMLLRARFAFVGRVRPNIGAPFFEILTWSQLGIHAKPNSLLNVASYYDGLLAMLDHAVSESFYRGIANS